MDSLTLASTFGTFLALLGPQKVLLAFAPVARREETQTAHRVALLSSLAAIVVGTACAWAAPWLTGIFHISTESVELAGGLIFFIYAVGLVLGLHLGLELGSEEGEHVTPAHPVISGFRELLLPYVVSPLGVTAVLVESLSAGGWGWRSTVAGAFAAVAAVNALCMIVLGPAMRRVHATTFEVLSRLLGMLLAAVGVELFLQGLTVLGVLPRH
ncbi:MAG: MarC family protein [Streptosporangiaceae bacterium]|jgi:multiple antibiotic resistance protein